MHHGESTTPTRVHLPQHPRPGPLAVPASRADGALGGGQDSQLPLATPFPTPFSTPGREGSLRPILGWCFPGGGGDSWQPVAMPEPSAGFLGATPLTPSSASSSSTSGAGPYLARLSKSAEAGLDGDRSPALWPVIFRAKDVGWGEEVLLDWLPLSAPPRPQRGQRQALRARTGTSTGHQGYQG